MTVYLWTSTDRTHQRLLVISQKGDFTVMASPILPASWATLVLKEICSAAPRRRFDLCGLSLDLS